MVLSVLRVGLVGGLLATLVFVVALALRSRVKAWLAPASASRPRWHYLLAAFGWLAVASSLVLLSLWIGTGLPSRAGAALGIWSGLYALVLIGRAASWGRIRTLLWWTY